MQTGDRLLVHSRSSAMVNLLGSDLVGLHAAPVSMGTGQDMEILRQGHLVIVEALVRQRLFVRPRQQALQCFLQLGGVCRQVYRVYGGPLG